MYHIFLTHCSVDGHLACFHILAIEHSDYIVGGNVNWCNHCGFLRKLQIELPFDLAIPLLGIYPEKTMTRKDICTSVFIAALFTIAKTWKQPKCPSTDEWIKNTWYYSVIKRTNNAIFNNMGTTRDSHIEWSKSEKERQIPNDVTYMWSLKRDTNDLSTKQKQIMDMEGRRVFCGGG